MFGFILKDSIGVFNGSPHHVAQTIDKDHAWAFRDNLTNSSVVLSDHIIPIYDINTTIKLPTNPNQSTNDNQTIITKKFMNFLTEQAHNFKIPDDVYYTWTRFIMPHVDRVVNNDHPNVPYIVWKTSAP